MQRRGKLAIVTDAPDARVEAVVREGNAPESGGHEKRDALLSAVSGAASRGSITLIAKFSPRATAMYTLTCEAATAANPFRSRASEPDYRLRLWNQIKR